MAEAPAVVTVGRLIRIFQGMNVASLLLGWTTYFGLLDFLATPDMIAMREFTGSAALLSPLAMYYLYMAMQPVWLLVTIGLCFFAWWSRPLFVGAYVVGAVLSLASGVSVWFPWDYFLVSCTLLLDGAIFALAFLPPLSGYFAREQSSA